MGKFVITRSTNGMFQFDFRNKKGQRILCSGEYTRKAMCINGIESVKRSSQDYSKFKKKRFLDSKCYFKLKAFNGKIIAISQIFKKKALRDNGVEFVKSNALKASIEDQSSDKLKRNLQNVK